jgi:ribosome-associated heat shock protein Hsp15
MDQPALRLDKWLWYARFFKSRTLATKFCEAGRLRVNGDIVKKAHYKLCPDDVLTFPKGDHIRVIKVIELGKRRGPAVEAQSLYEDLDPPQPRSKTDPDKIISSVARRDPGSGRPTKAERRATERLRPDAG